MIPAPASVKFASVIPNPKLKLLEQIGEAMRLKHNSTRTVKRPLNCL